MKLNYFNLSGIWLFITAFLYFGVISILNLVDLGVGFNQDSLFSMGDVQLFKSTHYDIPQAREWTKTNMIKLWNHSKSTWAYVIPEETSCIANVQIE